ncbi:MAG TPA: protein kinase [bacterium]|nr:protein kinase [bacterium]
MLQGNIDKYKLLEIKGSGTFGTVWLAEDTWIGKKVAIKIPHNQKEEFTTLIAEPKLLASLDHPNIVQILTVDKAENIFFMVMEYVDGKNLAQLIQETPLTYKEAVDIVIQILNALQYAHEKNVIHRDLKPGNILLTAERKAKITDFGTALIQTGKSGATIGGTLYYMSKEQVLGHPAKASDVYSVGVILYEMVTGKLPFYDEVPMAVLNKILKDDVPEPHKINAKVPKEIEAVIMKALQKEVSKRYQTAAEMRQDLEKLPANILEAPIGIGSKTQDILTHTIIQEETKKQVSKEVGDINSLRYQGYHYKLVKTIGTRGKEEGNFISPVAVAVDGQKRVYVCDSMKCNVQVFDPDGKHLYTVGKFGKEVSDPKEVSFLLPVSIAVDQGGNLVALDAKTCNVQVIGKMGQLLAKFGEPASPTTGKIEIGAGGFFHPQALALDDKDNIYVSDTGNHRIRVFNPAGKVLNKFGIQGARLGEFNCPAGLVLDSSGNLLVVDEKNYRVQIFTAKGAFKNKFGKRGTSRGEFMAPVGIAVDSKRNIFVTDRDMRIQVFDPEGYYLTEFGTPQGNYKIAPKYYGVAMDAENSLYVTDIANCSVLVYALKK